MLLQLAVPTLISLILNVPSVQASGKLSVTNRSPGELWYLMKHTTTSRMWVHKVIPRGATDNSIDVYNDGNSLYFYVDKGLPVFQKEDPSKGLPYLLANISVPSSDPGHVHYYWHGGGAGQQPYVSCSRTIVPHVNKKDGSCKDIGYAPKGYADEGHLTDDLSDVQGVCGRDVDLEVILENCI